MLKTWIKVAAAAAMLATGAAAAPTITATLDAPGLEGPIDGRLILILSTSDETEPRFQTGWRVGSPQIFGVDVEGARPGTSSPCPDDAFGGKRTADEGRQMYRRLD